MKFTIAAITLACAFAAQDATPPVISLDLSTTPHTTQNAIYGSASNARATTAIKSSSAAASKDSTLANHGTSQYARKCAVGSTKTECPSPDAVAYDHHDTDLTSQIQVACTQYVTSNVGEKPFKSNTACTVEDNKLGAAEYAKRGEFVLTYNVKDSSLNEAEQLIFAMVMTDEVAPEITVQSPFTSNTVEACLPSNYVADANRCIGTGINAAADDNYDGVSIQSFTAQTTGAASDYTTGSSVDINIRQVGTKTVTFVATDFADIFGAGNSDNSATKVVSTEVVDTTAPRVSLRHSTAFVIAATDACTSTTIPNVNSLNECAVYNAENVISAGSVAATASCGGCDDTACYTAGTTKSCKAVTTTSSKWECGVAVPNGDVVFSSAGAALASGAICVDDRASAATNGKKNDATAITAIIDTPATLDVGAAHGTAIDVTYRCTDGTATLDVSATRTVTIQDTIAPELFITRQGLRTATAPSGHNNYWTHSGDTKECDVADGATGTKDAECDDNDGYDAATTIADMCAEVGENTQGCVDNDLTTVYHSAGYTQDYKYIQALVAQGATTRKGYFCRDTCQTDSAALNAAYDETSNVGVKINWFTCGRGADTCCNADGSDKASNAVAATNFDTLDRNTYAIVYECFDGQQSTTKCRTIVNQDHAKPVISILEGNVLVYEASSVSNYVDAGATCWDEVDGNISEDVEVSGDVVNLARVGVYMIMYDCTDSSGNAATQATRQVTVQDSTCPTCTFTDADNQDIILEASFPFTDPAFGTNPDVSCTDELNTNLTPTATYLESDKTTVTTVDQITANTGKYYVTYIVTDDVGNTNEIKTDKTDTDAATGKVSGSTTKSCTFQTLSTATTADPTATLTAMDYDASSYTRTIEVKDTLRPVIKLKYGDTEIKAGTPNAIAHKGDNAGYDHQTFEAKSSAYQHQGLFAPKAASLMAEESQESVNGWVLGAIASAVSGLALLGYSLRKQAQPVATSVPV